MAKAIENGAWVRQLQWRCASKKKIKVNLQIERTETTLGTKIKIVPLLGRGNKQWHTHTMECWRTAAETNLRCICGMKGTRFKKSYTVWFHLYCILKKVKLQGQKTDQQTPEVGGRGRGWLWTGPASGWSGLKAACSEGPRLRWMLCCYCLETFHHLSLNLCFVSEVWWINGVCLWAQKIYTVVFTTSPCCPVHIEFHDASWTQTLGSTRLWEYSENQSTQKASYRTLGLHRILAESMCIQKQNENDQVSFLQLSILLVRIKYICMHELPNTNRIIWVMSHTS